MSFVSTDCSSSYRHFRRLDLFSPLRSMLHLVCNRAPTPSRLAAYNRQLVVAKAVKREYGGELEHLRAAVEILDRYPGILRFLVG